MNELRDLTTNLKKLVGNAVYEHGESKTSFQQTESEQQKLQSAASCVQNEISASTGRLEKDSGYMLQR